MYIAHDILLCLIIIHPILIVAALWLVANRLLSRQVIASRERRALNNKLTKILVLQGCTLREVRDLEEHDDAPIQALVDKMHVSEKALAIAVKANQP